MASAPEPPWTRLVREYETTRSFKMMGAIRAARDHLDGREAAETCGDTQEHPTLSSDFVRACLRAKMYDVRKAVDLVHSYQRFRRKSGWHTASGEKNVTAAATSSTLLSGFNLVLPSADVNGHVVLTQQMGLIFGDSSSSEGGGSLEAAQRAGFYLLHRALERQSAQTRGLALLLDFRGFGLDKLRKIRWSDLRRGVSMLQDSIPAKLECIYIVHQPRWIVYLVTLLRPLLRRQTLQQKFVLLGDDYARLHEYFEDGAAALPVQLDVGGTLQGFEEAWKHQVAEWAAEEEMLQRKQGAFDPASLIARGGALIGDST